METITIPKHLAGRDLLLVPKEEYEALQERARLAPPRGYKTVAITAAQRRAFEKAEKNFAAGRTFSLDVFRRKLGIGN
ncbi:MAG: hypothetical protein HYW65_00125 [Candidatus Liptonbacteria bacterium]|nr:hypothetical protein [Candidatus Liptonbacteria bacterium]